MRSIDATLQARIELAQQTLFNNANPQMDVQVTRPRTPITRAGFWQESIVTEDATAICTSVAVRRQVKNPTRAYVAYVTSGGTLVVKWADLSLAWESMVWTVAETISGCVACAVELDGSFVQAPRNRVEYLTDATPWLFYVTDAGALMGGPLGGTYETLVATNVTAVDAIRGVASLYKDVDQGLLVFYIINGAVYYREYINGSWESQLSVSLAPANAVRIKAERVFDWRIVLQVADNTGALYEVFSRMESSGWQSLERAVTLSGAGVTSTELINIDYADYTQEDTAITLVGVGCITVLNMSIYSPALRAAHNIATSTEDPENPGQYYDDYGYRVVFEFNQCVINAAEYPGDFKLVDSYGSSWYGQQAVVEDRFVIVTFTDFNNAGNPITAYALAGNLWNGYTALTETSVAFNATGLVPTFIPSPVPQSATNIQDWSES